MNKGESTRLDRIEEKIDKLADAVVSIARAEEKLSGLEQLNVEQHRKLTDIEDRLRVVETKVHDVETSMGVLNKVIWIALTALNQGFICNNLLGSAFFMMSFIQYLVENPLTVRQRNKKRLIMKRASKKMEITRRINAKRKATYEQLKRRAIMQAKTILRNKFLEGKEMTFGDLSDIQKRVLDRKVDSRVMELKAIARKLLPKIKEQESLRLQKLKNNAATSAQ